MNVICEVDVFVDRALGLSKARWFVERNEASKMTVNGR